MSPMQKLIPDNTQNSQETDIHVPGRIQIRNPSKWMAADPCLRSCSHRDRHRNIYQVEY